MSDETPRGEMPFLDHLEELRWRILKSLIAIVVGTAIGWLVVQNVDVIELLKRPIAPHLPGGRLVFTSPTEPFLLTLKVAFAIGALLASPAVIYQIWAFLSPALYARERRIIVPALSVGVVLFAAGAAAAYQYALPAALDVLFSFQRADLSAVITIDKYFGFALPFILAFGLITELPLVVVILASLGVVTPGLLARNRRYAIVVSAFAAALLTPPDALSMIMMMVPLLLLYEISIFAAWVVVRRQARRRAAEAPGAGTALLLALTLGTATGLAAQGPPVKPDSLRRRPPRAADSSQAIDTGLARRIGLPTGPTRSFPPSDAIIDSLLRLQGYQVTRYVADTMVVEGDSGTIYLRGEAFLEREGTQLEADSVKYREAACRLDASGDPKLFDQTTVLVGEGMRYDTCLKRGTVNDAFTDFEQAGATWYMRGNIAVDSGSTRLYGATSKFTSDERPEPDYHFLAGQVKWINKNVMVARPAVLYVRDVPILWLPFIFKDIRSGRRSGVLVPSFGLTDLVRTSRGYQRHVLNVGYYFALNNYMDLEVAADWYAGRNYTLRGRMQYRWLDRFVSGGLSYARLAQTDASATTTTIGWNHQQRFDSRTAFNASINYTTHGQVVHRNSINPFVATATMNSGLNFEKRFSWGTFTAGGNRKQDLTNGQVTMNFPEVRLTPTAVNVGSWLTWSPQFSYTNNQTFHNAGQPLLVPGDSLPDTAAVFFDERQTGIAFSTPLRLGRWNWSNSVNVQDRVSDKREEVVFDSTAPGGARRVVFNRTFETRVDWQTGINLPALFSGTWKLQPGIAILNATSAGPFMIRNQFSGGAFVRQGKRLAFNASIAPAFFGFFPGVGPLERIRHSFTPLVSYQFAPGASVPDAYARAVDPTGKNPNARTDPQQTISFGLSQNFEGKVRRAGADTASDQPARKVRLLSINTGGIGYNFEQAKRPGRTGWTTQSINNTFASELLPGFSLSLNHNLWDGPVGFDTTRFDPFLQSVSASFSITPATLAGLASLVGLRPRRDRDPAAPAPGAGGGALGGLPGQQGVPGPGQGYVPIGSMGGGGGRAFSLSASYSSTRARDDTVEVRAGRQQLNLNLNFSPTAKWTANWTTAYDLETGRFGQHYLRFERDLNRWHASFAFIRSANGNVAFSFAIALLDQPEIKFDYDQQTFTRP